MVNEFQIGSTLSGFIEAEAENLRLSLDLFGESIAIVGEVDALYALLAGHVGLLDLERLAEHPEALGSMTMLFGSCRIQFTLGIITLLRCHWTDSLMYIRKATEACAIAARIRQHPDFAQVWANAGRNASHYEKFKHSFKNLFPSNDALLSEVFKSYDHASRILHGSPLSLKGHVAFTRHSPMSLDIHFNAFDMKYKDEIAASLFFHLVSHKSMLRVFARIFTKHDATVSNEFETALESLNAKLETQRSDWHNMFPIGGGW